MSGVGQGRGQEVLSKSSSFGSIYVWLHGLRHGICMSVLMNCYLHLVEGFFMAELWRIVPTSVHSYDCNCGDDNKSYESSAFSFELALEIILNVAGMKAEIELSSD